MPDLSTVDVAPCSGECQHAIDRIEVSDALVIAELDRIASRLLDIAENMAESLGIDQIDPADLEYLAHVREVLDEVDDDRDDDHEGLSDPFYYRG